MKLHNYQQVHGLIKGISFVINSRYNLDSQFKTISLKRNNFSHFHNFDISHDENNIYMSFDSRLNDLSFKWLDDGSVEVKHKLTDLEPLWHVNIQMVDSFNSFTGKKIINKIGDTKYQFSIGVL